MLFIFWRYFMIFLIYIYIYILISTYIQMELTHSLAEAKSWTWVKEMNLKTWRHPCLHIAWNHIVYERKPFRGSLFAKHERVKLRDWTALNSIPFFPCFSLFFPIAHSLVYKRERETKRRRERKTHRRHGRTPQARLRQRAEASFAAGFCAWRRHLFFFLSVLFTSSWLHRQFSHFVLVLKLLLFRGLWSSAIPRDACIPHVWLQHLPRPSSQPRRPLLLQARSAFSVNVRPEVSCLQSPPVPGIHPSIRSSFVPIALGSTIPFPAQLCIIIHRILAY